ncbi:histidine-rich glycoprotein-like isoform X1 [Microplitis mediator]|uniref:histidine-rich glycoprotein-like isoform X1 n=2 Tax=Microplitis mediator TaxID=375433 RepID=UPI0025561032|nr:histidine-rich glycoprotein-like isoform X1 [Microplitis mediator]
MTPKLILTTCLCMLMICQVRTGIVSVSDASDEHHQHQHQHQDYGHEHVPVATSYMHFHGPVEGPEFQVKVPYVIPHHYENHYQPSEHQHQENNDLAGHHSHVNEHQADEAHGYIGHTTDYVAHPKYEFAYGVEDHHTGDFHEQKEVRDGTSVSGEYRVKEPGGSVRIVKYKADKDGFHAHVETKGKNDHSGATYTTHAHLHQHEPTHHDDNQNHHHLQLHAEDTHYEYSHDAYA